MRIGIARVDHGVTGGFERVLTKVREILEGEGHHVVDLAVDAATVSRRPFGLEVAPESWWRSLVFNYMGLFEEFLRLEPEVDLLISSHAPSFATRHPRHLSLFFQHWRLYYEQLDIFSDAGFEDPALLERAARSMRSVDDLALQSVSWFLAGSRPVKDRLLEFNGIYENVSLFHAGPAIEERRPVSRNGPSFALCVSRQAFPKRGELFVHAMKYLPELPGVLVGEGPALEWVRHVDAWLSAPGSDLDAVTDRELWLNRGVPESRLSPAGDSNVSFLGYVPDRRLDELYASALCVVAPAFGEDYGLTAVEALSHGRPLIVCTDGGTLTQFVEHGENGFVVEPKGAAIAEAVRLLASDPSLARRFGDRSREIAKAYTWDRARAELLAAIDRLCA